MGKCCFIPNIIPIINLWMLVSNHIISNRHDGQSEKSIMTLHEAIENLLRETRRPMSAREIADGLNSNKWYVKGDQTPMKTNQITARVDDHHELFEIDRSESPHKIKLIGI